MKSIVDLSTGYSVIYLPDNVDVIFDPYVKVFFKDSADKNFEAPLLNKSNSVLIDNLPSVDWKPSMMKIVEGQWVDCEKEIKDAQTKEQATQVRTTRNAFLRESDWTQVLDAPVDRAAWAVYRQALRDITAQAGFPWDVEWPAKPE